MRKSLFGCAIILLLLLDASAFASQLRAQSQQLRGEVRDGQTQDALPGAQVLLLEVRGQDTLRIGSALSDTKGAFRLVLPGGTVANRWVEVSYLGYETLRLAAQSDEPMQFALPEDELRITDEVVITGTLQNAYLSESPVRVEVMPVAVINRQPVASISEAFEFVNGVQLVTACGVCATQDIHINGLEGSQTLVLIDGMPIVGNLSGVYGLSGLPSVLLDRMEIIKGPASTIYGTEALGGVVNIVTRDPRLSPRLSVNTWASSHAETHSELLAAPHLGRRGQWRPLLVATYSHAQTPRDDNKDGFTDFPLHSRLSLFGKLEIPRASGRRASLLGRYYYEDRFGGQTGWDWTQHERGNDQIYGESIITRRIEVLGTYEFGVPGLRLDYSYNWHDQDSYYGQDHYTAQQQVYFANLLYVRTLGRHLLRGGLTLRHQTYQDNTTATQDGAVRDFIPGVFVEDEWKLGDQWLLLAGGRLDHHRAHGLVPSPRLALKYTPHTNTVVRLNYGTGFRLVNVFTEDHAFISGSRTLVFAEQLRPERSQNLSLGLQQTFTAGKGVTQLSLDGFYTMFDDKLIPDYDSDPNLIIYANLPGQAISRGASLGLRQLFRFPLTIDLGITYLNVYERVPVPDLQNQYQREPVPYAPTWRGVGSLGWRFPKLGLSIDWLANVTGPMALPTFPEPFERPALSHWFTQHNVQFTQRIRSQWQVYAALKNIFNYTQPTPLIAPEDPFGPDFDTAYAYGPLQTRRVVLGVRWNWQ